MNRALLRIVWMVVVGIFGYGEMLAAGGRRSDLLGDKEDEVLMMVEDDTVWLSDFAYIYKKNSEEAIGPNKSLDEYLNLFTIFKLKVHEARMQGVDTTASFKREFRSYRAQATVKYMRDDEALDSLVEVGYDRMSRDRSASHIAVACPSNASDSVRTLALSKIRAIRESVMANKDKFNDIALEQSEDPNVKQNAGHLGWIRPYRYVYAFEEAVYNTPVGEVSEVFESPFGYHIVKVEEELRHEEVRVRHIMKMFNSGDEVSIATSEELIDSIYDELQRGGNFLEIAEQESDDKGSASKGGDVGWFGRGVMVAPFEKVAFSLDIDEMSEPFRSDYGWHIILKMDHRDILPLDSLRKQILNTIEHDERMKIADAIFVKKMRALYNLPDTMSNNAVKGYADARLEERYEDLWHVVKEYHDGIMLFEVSLKEVWNKASLDTAGLQQYFANHKANYKWDGPKYKGFAVQCRDSRVASLVDKMIKNNASRYPDSVVSYINSVINVDSVPSVKVVRGLWSEGDNGLVDKFAFGVKDAEFSPSEDLPVAFVRGKKIKKPEDYRDVRTNVVSDYQDELDKEWVALLKKKYKVTINEEVFNRFKAFVNKE